MWPVVGGGEVEEVLPLFLRSAIVCPMEFIFLRAIINSELTLANSSMSALFVAVIFATVSLSLAVAVARLARASTVSLWYSVVAW